MSWQQYVELCQQHGFSKETLINRANWQPIAYSSVNDVATAYKDGEVDVNENQELLDDWKEKKKATFRFYGQKFNIVQRDDADGNWIVGSKGQEVICAYKFKSIYFIAYGQVAKKAVKKEEDQGSNSGFKSVPDAFNVIMKDIFDPLKSIYLLLKSNNFYPIKINNLST